MIIVRIRVKIPELREYLFIHSRHTLTVSCLAQSRCCLRARIRTWIQNRCEWCGLENWPWCFRYVDLWSGASNWRGKGDGIFFGRCPSIRKRFSKICMTYSPDDAVCRHGKHKVFPRLLIFDAGLIAEQLLEINGQSDIRLSAELVAGFAIRNAFDHSTTAIQMKRPENDMTWWRNHI